MLIVEKLKLKEKMSVGEETVADFLMSLGKDVEKYSTRNIAEVTYTSPATVVRLCKKIGFKGFDDFKSQYLKEIDYLDQQYGSVDVNFPFSKNDSIMKMANKMVDLYDETIRDTLSLMKHEVLKNASNLMKHSKAIHIFSSGTTLNQAECFKEKMLKIGKQVIISNNLNYQLYEANCIQQGDIAIIISYSGETKNVVRIAQSCKSRGIPIIAITSFGENTLSQLAFCKLIISTKESLFKNIGDFSIHLSVNLILDVLYSSYFLLDYDDNYELKLNTAKILENLRKSSNPIIMNEEED
ncbi:MurR/RpiR family transcriptional regulator [Breznakia pachnodae]|uniref:DNA-binding MurR/RpiR family transcriptional regulator n=1 Tax=Breznakia pachnodae TaxID=265178 RepID=A0ABU0E964_9FIRM|nr:MurR/RpiR family transcriptional regulator [Breznakia pachnodae]MDQ0363274.1 DNA-binding MurR/RpiR family transcriptional regulator [Breznakia pachnodae]